MACGPLTAAEVDETMAAFLAADEPTMRPYLDGLATRGWVRIDPDAVALTDEGRAAHQRISAQAAALRQQLTACVTPQEFTTLMTLLQRLAAHVDTVAAAA